MKYIIRRESRSQYHNTHGVFLEADLIHLGHHWSKVAKTACPINFTGDKKVEGLRLSDQHIEAEKCLQASSDAIGTGTEGWLPVEQYEKTNERESRLSVALLRP
jgi:hypothetical protein